MTSNFLTSALETEIEYTFKFPEKKIIFKNGIAYIAYHSSRKAFQVTKTFTTQIIFSFRKLPWIFSFCSLQVFSSSQSFYRESAIKVFPLIPTKHVKANNAELPLQ